MASKIGVFCPTLNVYGGGEYVAIAIANTLAENNREVVLFSADKIDPQAIQNYFGKPLNPSIQTLQQATNFAPRSLADFYQTIIHSYIAKNKCQVFIDAFSNCVYPWTQISYIHFPYLNRYNFSINFPYLNRPRLNQAGTLPHVILEKNLIDYNNRLILANSHYTAGEIQRYSHKTAKVLYPPFPANITSSEKDITKNREENLVVTVSRLDTNKRLERIPEIAAKSSRDIKFAVIGRLYNQHMLDYLQAIVKRYGVEEQVKFYPNASAEQKTDLLKKAKIYLHTMEGEHFGISIVEAMAYGCVPVVHDSGGMREFVPVHLRYSTLTQAVEKIASQIADWEPVKIQESIEIAAEFSLQRFSDRFMKYFAEYTGRI